MFVQVIELLQRKSRFPPARFCKAGSVGKATAIPGYDNDFVAFINGQEPPFESVLDDYEDILMLTNRPKIVNLKKTIHSLQFQANGIDIDLLPAQNFVSGFLNLGGDALAKKQANLALEQIQEKYKVNRGTIYNYSSSLAEAHVMYMKRQSGFIHELARLCKFWNKTLTIDAYISGRSTIIELLAIYAGQTEENNQSSPSILRAFNRFLENMKNLDKIGISFQSEVLNLTCSPPEFPKPFIIEPSNPFNNLAKGIKPRAMEQFKKFAGETLRRLKNEVLQWSRLGYFPLELLFEAQPRIVKPGTGATPSRRLVDVIECTRKNPRMIVRNDKKFGKEISAMQRTVQNSLFTQIHALTSAGKPGVSDFDVQELAIGQVARHAYGVDKLNWGFGSAATERHEDFDVTFELPYADQPRAIVASFSWN